MKLTIHQLTPYFPYQLLCDVKDFDGIIHHNVELTGAATLSSYESFQFIENGDMNGDLMMIHIEQIFPLLIPLYELSKQQVIDIFAAGFLNAGHKYWPIYNIDIEWHDKFAVELLYKKASFSLDFANSQFETQPFAFNQKKAFEKIYELHGDINGLIEAGLAINKNHTKS